MRAVYLKNLNNKENSILIKGDPAKHLLKVARASIGQDVLLLNGKGLQADGVISQISKNEVIVDVTKFENIERKFEIDLFLCNPKKDAFESIIRSSVELGIGKIYSTKSEFSQFEYKPSDRINAIIESALIQSNNPFATELEKVDKFEQIVEISRKYETCVFFDSQNEIPTSSSTIGPKLIYIIGPEGGFSEQELKLINDIDNAIKIHFKTPILKSATAASVAAGYLLANLKHD